MANNPKDGREHYQVVPDSVLYDKKLKHSAIRVYAYLAGQYRPRSPWKVVKGIRTIAKGLGMGGKTVQIAVQALNLRGHIHVEIRRNSAGVVDTSEYYFISSHFDGPHARAPWTDHVEPPKTVLKSQTRILKRPNKASRANGQKSVRRGDCE